MKNFQWRCHPKESIDGFWKTIKIPKLGELNVTQGGQWYHRRKKLNNENVSFSTEWKMKMSQIYFANFHVLELEKGDKNCNFRDLEKILFGWQGDSWLQWVWTVEPTCDNNPKLTNEACSIVLRGLIPRSFKLWKNWLPSKKKINKVEWKVFVTTLCNKMWSVFLNIAGSFSKTF